MSINLEVENFDLKFEVPIWRFKLTALLKQRWNFVSNGQKVG